jgi:hypothetical protein
MGRFLLLAVALVSSAACKKDKSEGLPPAQEWSANTNTLPNVTQQGQPANPHAGMANPRGGGDPHAGMNMGGADPHAGMDMGGAGMANPHGSGGPPMANPHGGSAAPPPAVDPTHRVAGKIVPHAKAKDRMVEGTAVFVFAKQVGPDGQPVGMPIVAERLEWKKDGIDFVLDETKMRMSGAPLVGDVVIIARYDLDSDAMSKKAGDVAGQLKVKVPADKVTVTLDDVLQ